MIRLQYWNFGVGRVIFTIFSNLNQMIPKNIVCLRVVGNDDDVVENIIHYDLDEFP